MEPSCFLHGAGSRVRPVPASVELHTICLNSEGAPCGNDFTVGRLGEGSRSSPSLRHTARACPMLRALFLAECAHLRCRESRNEARVLMGESRQDHERLLMSGQHGALTPASRPTTQDHTPTVPHGRTYHKKARTSIPAFL